MSVCLCVCVSVCHLFVSSSHISIAPKHTATEFSCRSHVKSSSTSRLHIPVFRDSILWTPKTFPVGFVRIYLFFLSFSRGIFHRNVVLEGSWKFLFSAAFTGILAGIPRTGIPVFAPDSSGFLWIPVPPKNCLARPGNELSPN